MTDPSGTTTYTYSNRDQVLTKATPEGTLTYTYHKFGHPLSVASSNANGTNVAYARDADERLQSVTDNRTSGATMYPYDQTNQLSTMAYPNGVSHVFQYDNRDRTIQLNVNGPSAAITSYQQTFSYSGRKLSATELTGRAANYSYDSIYRLTNETISGDATASMNGMLTYGLDPVGNRQSLTSTVAALGRSRSPTMRTTGWRRIRMMPTATR
jgi:YD repeat-containing protein